MSAQQKSDSNPEIVVCQDRDELSRRAAELWIATVEQAIKERGRASISLSGGSTPKSLYELLATPDWKKKNDWQRLHLFWGDERGVPPDDKESNYRMVREALIDKVSLPASNVHRMKTELGAKPAADDYERELRQFFPNEDMPPFDLVLMGLGENGHTASLFPHTKILRETKRWVAAEFIEEVHMDRISLTAPALNDGRVTAFMVSGSGKAEVLHEVIEGKHDPERLPAQLIQPAGRLLWLLDRDAAARLNRRAS